MHATAEKWKHVTFSLFGKKSKMRWSQVMVDILCVAEGLKPACLFDHWSVDSETMRSYLVSLFSEGLVTSLLGVLVIGADILVYNSTHKNWLELPNAMLPEFVDVTAALDQPSLVKDKKKEVSQTTRVFEQWCQRVRENDMTPNDSVLEISITDSLNVPALFGLLLGYPCVYWYDRNVGEDNNLSACPLRLYQVRACMKTESPPPHYHGRSTGVDTRVSVSRSSSAARDGRDASATLYSFTVPENVVSSVRYKVWAWYKACEKPVLHSNLFSAVWMSEETVEPGAVCL